MANPLSAAAFLAALKGEGVNSGPGRTLYAHAEHAALYRPDPRPAVLLARIHARREQQR